MKKFLITLFIAVAFFIAGVIVGEEKSEAER